MATSACLCVALSYVLPQEKEDANFKLMSDRIKHNSVQKLLREEKELMEEQVSALHTERARSVVLQLR